MEFWHCGGRADCKLSCLGSCDGGSGRAKALAEKYAVKAFIDALEGECDFEIDGAEARKSVELILAIYQSAREQRLIKLR